MGFLLVGFLLWGLIVASILLFIWGVWKKSRKAFVWSGVTFLGPAIILATQKGWFTLFLLWLLVTFGAAFYTNKNHKSTDS